MFIRGIDTFYRRPSRQNRKLLPFFPTTRRPTTRAHLSLPRRAWPACGAALALAGALASPARAFDPAPGGGPVSTAQTGARCTGPAFDDTVAFQAAIDTGRTVYAPALGGACHITRPLVMKTPGQILYGDGRARTKIAIEPGFAGAGVFVAATGGPGPVWRDFSISFVQPDTDDRAKLVHYPPAFFVPDTPRFEMQHLGCYLATKCIDMTGNSGGATIDDLQFDAFETGIDIDGSLDTVRIIDPHWWPFGLSKGLQEIFFDQGPARATAIKVGRMDDLVIRGGLFLGGLALHLYQGKTGPAFGTVDGTDFDSTSGLQVTAGSLTIGNVFFGMALPYAQALKQTGGSINISSSRFYLAGKTGVPLISVSDSDVSISDSNIATGTFDESSIMQSGATSFICLTGNLFARNPNLGFKRATIDVINGRIFALGNFATDKGLKEGVFLRISKSSAENRIFGNASPGWSNVLPVPAPGPL